MKVISSFIRPQEFILHTFDNGRSCRQVTHRNCWKAFFSMKFREIKVADKKVSKNKCLRCVSEQPSDIQMSTHLSQNFFKIFSGWNYRHNQGVRRTLFHVYMKNFIPVIFSYIDSQLFMREFSEVSEHCTLRQIRTSFLRAHCWPRNFVSLVWR